MEEFKLSKNDIFIILRQLLGMILSQHRAVCVPWQQVEKWQFDTPINELGAGADSLEIIEFSTATFIFFQLNNFNKLPLLDSCETFGSWVDNIYQASIGRFSALGFVTSGTIDKKKLCVHPLEKLVHEARYLAKLLPELNRVVLLAPVIHLYGFIFGILLPKILKTPVIDLKSYSIASLSTQLNTGDLLIGYPDIWSPLILSQQKLPEQIHLISSTAPCSSEIKNNLFELGINHIWEIYGTTEAGGIGYRKDREPLFKLFDYCHIHSDNHTLVQSISSNTQYTYQFSDKITWQDNQYFRIDGRLDNQIQISGVNINLTRIEQTINDHPLVHECAVRKMDLNEGHRLKSYIVMDNYDLNNTQLNQEKITQWLNSKLSAVERPKHITFGAELPRNNYGKLKNWSILPN